jgi:uncharacterized protein YxjI
VNVTIKEHKFSLRSEYDISAPSVAYSAQKAYFSLLDKLEIQTGDGRVVASLKSHLTVFATDYDFLLADGRTYKFTSEKIWKGVYLCEGSGENYHLYQHKGLLYSIFKGDSQIAAISRNSFVIGSGNEYDIAMNSDADVVVISCMILALNTHESDDNNDAFTFDFGSIGPEDRKFYESWGPS